MTKKNKNPTQRMWGTRTPHKGCGEKQEPHTKDVGNSHCENTLHEEGRGGGGGGGEGEERRGAGGAQEKQEPHTKDVGKKTLLYRNTPHVIIDILCPSVCHSVLKKLYISSSCEQALCDKPRRIICDAIGV